MTDPFGDPPPAFAAYWTALVAHARDPAHAPRPAAPAALAAIDALYGPVAAPAGGSVVVGQLGQSLDGFIATADGDSHYVTGPESRVHLHRLRALCEAVVVGWRTVAADDPRLTVRAAEGPDPLRVVIDPAGRLPADHRVFAGADGGGGGGALRLAAPGTPALAGVETVTVPAADGRVAPADVVDALRERGCRRLLVEGGGRIVSAFLAAGALDRLHLAVAPLVIGAGRRGLDLPPAATLADALRPPAKALVCGADALFDLDLRAAEAGAS